MHFILIIKLIARDCDTIQRTSSSFHKKPLQDDKFFLIVKFPIPVSMHNGNDDHGASWFAFDEKQSFHPVQVELPAGCRMVAGGGQHSAFVLKTGELFLCGDNSNGQLGHSVDELLSSSIPLMNKLKICIFLLGYPSVLYVYILTVVR